MPVLSDLFKGFDATKHNTPDEVIKLVNTNASELKAKLLIDDGDKDVFVPKARLDEEIGKKKTIQKTLDDTNVELEKIKTSAGDNKTLTDQINTLQNSNKALDTKLKEQALETAIKLKALDAKSKDKSGADVLAFIDKAKLTLKEDGTVEGLDDAFKTLTESKPYLFDIAGGGTGNPGQRGKGGTNDGIDGIGKMLADQNKSANGNTQTVDQLYFK